MSSEKSLPFQAIFTRKIRVIILMRSPIVALIEDKVEE